jgi:predicted alpha-1,2-mannosidase
VEVISSTEVRGYTRIRGGWNVGKAYTVYYHAEFDQPCTSFVTYKDGELFTDQISQYDSGDRTGVICKLEDHENTKVKLKIGLSFVSVGKAKANLDREIPHWSFDRVVQETRAKWESLISRIEPDASAPEDQKTMFYTALYHTMLMPVDRSGENPYFTATPYYDDYYAIWDTYRTSSPLLTLISPSKQAEIINSLLNIYRYDDYMPDARSGNSNGRTQGGSNTAVVIADAYEKGLEGIDYELALEAMIKDATIPPGNLEEQEGRGGLPDYNTLGYVSQSYPRGGTRTMEYAYNDFVLASVAEGLGKEETYQHYLSQSDNWQNLWRDVEDNGSRGFIMPRNADGSWVETIYCNLPDSPDESIDYHPLARDWPRCVCWWCGFFYEGSSWEYSLYVPHDVSRLIEMSGGDDAFLRRLNSLFERGFYNVGNEVQPAYMQLWMLTSTLRKLASPVTMILAPCPRG